MGSHNKSEILLKLFYLYFKGTLLDKKGLGALFQATSGILLLQWLFMTYLVSNVLTTIEIHMTTWDWSIHLWTNYGDFSVQVHIHVTLVSWKWTLLLHDTSVYACLLLIYSLLLQKIVINNEMKLIREKKKNLWFAYRFPW